MSSDTGSSTVSTGDGLVDLLDLLDKHSHNSSAWRTVPAPGFIRTLEIRGTASIFWSCIITLLACVYTALHLNIPTHNGKVWILLSKAKWVFAGLIAPELVLYLATSQYIEARDLVNSLNEELQKAKGNGKQFNKAADDYRFDLPYGFYVGVMGGLEVAVEDIEPKHSDKTALGMPHSGRLRLTSSGVLQLAKQGHFIFLPESRISDKSKADVVQKTVVMGQVLWMALQCTVRGVFGLPLTLLEVHTMVHVVCALVIFVLWIRKPKDIQTPELVDSSKFADIIAFMYHESLIAENRVRKHRFSRKKPILQDQPWIWPRPENTDVEKGTHWVEVNEQDKSVSLQTGQAFAFGIGFKSHPDSDPASSSAKPTTFNPRDIERWKRIRQAVQTIEADSSENMRTAQPLRPDHPTTARYEGALYHKSFSTRAGNVSSRSEALTVLKVLDPWWFAKFLYKNKLLLVLVVFLPVVYGAIHVVQTDRIMFPTETERIMWFFSSIYVMVALPAVFPLGILKRSFWDVVPQFKWLAALFYYVLVFVLLAGYIFSRGFLVVEAFIGLRKVPIGVYWTPSWLQMIPHI
ncbi:hypothetical protein QBC36DRAFT_364454 [Triangularia setosa]|uniref:Uncharacterized protein n=1 Tax=Triangularia setosa TaxID=2587417 RepID=A0AAN6WK07_9PEZI|nr:hypothetical protein QBC36DRAFT_364454 [Podospora setosa]